MQVAVSCSLSRKGLVIKAVLSIHLAQLIGDAFTEEYNDENPVHKALSDLYGGLTEPQRWYCIDQADTTYAITYSDAANPKLMLYQGAPAAIATPDASAFRLFLTECDTVRPGRLNPTAIHKHHIRTTG